MTNTLGAKPSIDTSQFKKEIGDMNREIRVLESGFKSGAAALGDWSNSATGLENRAKTLTSQMEAQEKKVEALQAIHAKMVEAYGAESAAAQNAEIDLNKGTETLNKMDLELKTTTTSLNNMKSETEEAGSAVSDMGNETEETSTQLFSFKDALGAVGAAAKVAVAAVAAVAAATIAVGAAIATMVFDASAAAGALEDLSVKTHLSTTALQEMNYIGNQIGVSLDTITGAQAKLVRSMAAGREGTGAQADAFKALGVSVVDANGNLRSAQDVFNESIDALGKIKNPAEQDALAMDIFGKSAMELNPLIATGSAGMAEMAAQAHKVGAVMDEKTVKGLAAFDDTLASLQDGLKGTLGTLASAFVPGFQAVFDQVGGYLQTFAGIVSGADGDFGKMAGGITGLITQIVSDVAAQAPKMLEAGLGMVQSLLDAITTALPKILPMAVDIIKTLIGFIVQNLPLLIKTGVDILLTLITSLVENLPMIIDAALQAILALAQGLTDALPELIPAVVEALVTIVDTLLENLPVIVEAALNLILALAEGLVAALPILTPAIPKIMQAIFNAIILMLPMITKAAAQLLKTLYGGIIANLPLLGTAMVQLVTVVVNGMQGIFDAGITAGEGFITSIWEGIKNNSEWLLEMVKGLGENIVAAIKKVLGLTTTTGTEGTTGGQDAGFDLQIPSMKKTGNSLRRAFAGAGGDAGGAAGAQTIIENYAFYAPVYVNGQISKTLGQSLKGRTF